MPTPFRLRDTALAALTLASALPAFAPSIASAPTRPRPRPPVLTSPATSTTTRPAPTERCPCRSWSTNRRRPSTSTGSCKPTTVAAAPATAPWPRTPSSRCLPPLASPTAPPAPTRPTPTRAMASRPAASPARTRLGRRPCPVAAPPSRATAPRRRAMWRWQEIKEFQYPLLESESRSRKKPIWIGVEQNAPGHEHVSTNVLAGQLPWPSAAAGGNAALQAQYEYCFDRSDTDTSRGAENAWDCTVAGSANNTLIDATARKITGNNSATTPNLGHLKSVEGIKWMNEKAAAATYFVPAHLERAGAYNPTGSNGFNVEHLRDFNNAGAKIAFGFESMPGHQAEASRGSYTTGAVGGGTFAARASTQRLSAASGTPSSAKVATGGSSPAPTITTAVASAPTSARATPILPRRVHARFRDGEEGQQRPERAGHHRRPAQRQQLRGQRRAHRPALVHRLRHQPRAAAQRRQGLDRDGQRQCRRRQCRRAHQRLRHHGREAGRAGQRRPDGDDRPARPARHQQLALQLRQSVAEADQRHPAAQRTGARPRRCHRRQRQRLRRPHQHGGLRGRPRFGSSEQCLGRRSSRSSTGRTGQRPPTARAP